MLISTKHHKTMAPAMRCPSPCSRPSGASLHLSRTNWAYSWSFLFCYTYSRLIHLIMKPYDIWTWFRSTATCADSRLLHSFKTRSRWSFGGPPWVHHGPRESSENHDFPRSMVNPKVLQTQGSSQSLWDGAQGPQRSQVVFGLWWIYHPDMNIAMDMAMVSDGTLCFTHWNLVIFKVATLSKARNQTWLGNPREK